MLHVTLASRYVNRLVTLRLFIYFICLFHTRANFDKARILQSRLRYVTLRYMTLRYVTVRYVLSRYVTLRHD